MVMRNERRPAESGSEKEKNETKNNNNEKESAGQKRERERESRSSNGREGNKKIMEMKRSRRAWTRAGGRSTRPAEAEMNTKEKPRGGSDRGKPSAAPVSGCGLYFLLISMFSFGFFFLSLSLSLLCVCVCVCVAGRSARPLQTSGSLCCHLIGNTHTYGCHPPPILFVDFHYSPRPSCGLSEACVFFTASIAMIIGLVCF